MDFYPFLFNGYFKYICNWWDLPIESQTCDFNWLDWAGQVGELCRPDLEIDQPDVIWTGPGRSLNCVARTL